MMISCKVSVKDEDLAVKSVEKMKDEISYSEGYVRSIIDYEDRSRCKLSSPIPIRQLNLQRLS